MSFSIRIIFFKSLRLLLFENSELPYQASYIKTDDEMVKYIRKPGVISTAGILQTLTVGKDFPLIS